VQILSADLQLWNFPPYTVESKNDFYSPDFIALLPTAFGFVSHSSSYVRPLENLHYPLAVKSALWPQTPLLVLFDSMGRIYTSGRTHGRNNNENGCAHYPKAATRSHLGKPVLQIEGGV